MKRLLLSIAIVLIGSFLAQAESTPVSKEKNSQSETTVQVTLQGNVIDSQTLESLAGVALEIAGTKAVVYTDFEGNFQITNLEPGYYNIVVRFVSYKPHLIENVYLQPGNNNLQSIKLMAN